MKIWKSVFKKKYPGRRSRAIVENVQMRSIPREKLYPGPLDKKAGAEAAKQGDGVYARCGEVFRLP